MTLKCSFLFCVILVLSVYISVSETSDILLIPLPIQSLVFEMTGMGKALCDRGHHVSILLPSYYSNFLDTQHFPLNIMYYKLIEKDLFGMDQAEMISFRNILIDNTPTEFLRQHDGLVRPMCTNALSDEDSFQSLKAKQFDVAVVDGSVTGRCLMIIPYRLGIPYIATGPFYEPWILRSPALPSFVPYFFGSFTEKMSFMERILNLYNVLDWSISPRVSYLSDEFIAMYTPDKPFKSATELARDSKLWLMDTDELLDYPRPLMPNEINIGGLTTRDAGSLPDNLKIFADSAKSGLIISSFGSADFITPKYVSILLTAFKYISQHVILRTTYTAESLGTEIPENVLILPWIPQNDLLGHPNVKLLITHSGSNGQFEALYHAVPMLGIPINVDQPHNAKRVTYRGYGEHLDIHTMTTETVVTAIKVIINNQSYYDNLKKASKIFRNRPMTPQNRAAYWVERVLDNEVDHLYSTALTIPWYEYLMLDILAVVCGSSIIILMMLYWLLCFIMKYCKCHKPKAKTA